MYRRPLVFAALLLASAGVVAGPGVEERPTGSTGSSALSPEATVSVFEQIQQYQAQIEALTGRVEQLEYQLGRLRDEERARYVDLDSRINELKKQGAPALASPVVPPVEAAAPVDSEKAAYDEARRLLRDKQYDEAVEAFGNQLQRFPNGELASSAMFWLGELWLLGEKADPAKAGRYFFRVYNEFPKSSFAPDAMYKAGVLQCQAGELTRGRVTLNKVIVQFAGSRAATQAQAALKQQCGQ